MLCSPGASTAVWTPPTPMLSRPPGRSGRPVPAGVPLRRLLRPEGGEEGLRVDSPEEAARLLAGQEGNILLATGAKELPAFAALEPARLFPRVLPSEESVAACRRAGIPPGTSSPSTDPSPSA